MKGIGVLIVAAMLGILLSANALLSLSVTVILCVAGLLVFVWEIQ